MNERIKLLAEQAGIAVWGDAVYMYDPKDTLDSTVMEKFAELIVQECIDIIAPYTVRMSRPGEEYLHPILEIKQHFGVEE
jgi:hypothetical protein